MSGDETDIVSNDVLIQAMRQPDGVRQLLRDELPASVYPAFAHETTHHWCFLSPIGATVALLRARSDVALWRASTAHEVQVAIPGRLLADALVEAFRPLAEGIALFAQLNMRTSKTGLAIEPCEWVTHHLIRMPELESEMRAILPNCSFANADQVPDELYQRFVGAINAFLDHARLATEEVATRRRISMRRLDSGDGYLAGYLLIKRSYNRLLRGVLEGVDANSFLAFAKEFFFHDTDLALAVLTDSVYGVDSIVGRMAERVRLFESEEGVELYQNFVPAAERTSRVPILGRWKPTIAAAIDVHPDGDRAVGAAIRRIMEQERALPDKGDLDLAASTILPRVYGRDLFKLGTLEGALSTKRLNIPQGAKARTALFVPDAKYNMSSILVLPQKTEGPFNEAPASIELLFWSSADRMILACYVGIELAAVGFNRNRLTPEAAATCEALTEERLALNRNIAIIQRQVKVALNHVFKNFESDVNQQIRAALDDVLLGLLFPNAPDPKGMFSRLCSRGFFELYDSPNRPENFARFCATVACDRTPPQDESNDILAWSSRCEMDTGWPMLERSGERLLTAL